MINATAARALRPPVNVFGSSMALAGLGLAWRVAGPQLGAPPIIGAAIVALAGALFALLCLLYVLKAVRHWTSVCAEFTDAASAPYFGTIIISLSLLAYGALPCSTSLATVLWGIATAAGLILLLTLVRLWILRDYKLTSISPAWLVPVIGNATTVFAGWQLGYHEVAIVSFAIAVIYYLTLLPLIFHRLVFEEKTPARSAPSLAVLISSPAVLAIAVFQIAGHGNMLFDILVTTALFNAVLVASLWKITAGMPIGAGLWAYAFSTNELAGAVLRYHASVPGFVTGVLAAFVLTLATIVTVTVAILTISIISRVSIAAASALAMKSS
jgi:tellurite resistance protein